MSETKKPIHSFIEEGVDLAKTYAYDGAFASSARVFRQIAQAMEDHNDAINEAMERAADNAEKVAQ